MTYCNGICPNRAIAGVGRDIHSRSPAIDLCFRVGRLERGKYEAFAGDKVTMKEAS